MKHACGISLFDIAR